ncbi:hypothetical protein K502DRAFT_95729 [Neoconidiobolus thromboides FSU 785]|nr:hypothetical protein K502DRAFT_95729 [Neoconidiobolus thromboides FSU 785]
MMLFYSIDFNLVFTYRKIELKAGILKEELKKSRKVVIYERWEDKEVKIYREHGIKAESRKRLFLGGKMPLELECELQSSLLVAGGLGYCKLFICNRTSKKVQGIRLSLLQSIVTPDEPANKVMDPLRSVYDKIIKEEDIKVEPNDSIEYLCAIPIPVSFI